MAAQKLNFCAFSRANAFLGLRLKDPPTISQKILIFCLVARLYLENTKDSEDLKVCVFYCLTNHGSWGGCMYVNSIII